MKFKLVSTATILVLMGWVAPAHAEMSRTEQQMAAASPQMLEHEMRIREILSRESTVSSSQFTPAENNRIAGRMFDGAWNHGNFFIVDELVAADALDHSPLGTESGSEGFKGIIGMFRSAMPDLAMTIEDEVYSADRVVHRWRIVGMHTGEPLFGVPADGREITLTGITIVRMQDGQIVERWTQLDQLGLMQQLGLIPPRS